MHDTFPVLDQHNLNLLAIIATFVASVFSTLWLHKKVTDVHVVVNSRLSELILAERLQSYAQGYIDNQRHRESGRTPLPLEGLIQPLDSTDVA